jgi:hypothetical protein
MRFFYLLFEGLFERKVSANVEVEFWLVFAEIFIIADSDNLDRLILAFFL